MVDRLLVVGSDPAWLQAMRFLEDPAFYDSQVDGEGLPPKVIACLDSTTALAELDRDADDPISAAIIFGFHIGPTTSNEMGTWGYGARDLAIDLHAKRRSLPVLLAAQVRLDVLERFAASTENVEVIQDETILSIRAAIGRTRKAKVRKQPWAELDIHIGVESVGLRLTLANGQILADNRFSSDIRPLLEIVQEEFQPWELYKYDVPGTPRPDDGWPGRLCSVGATLHQYLVSDPQRKAIDDCLKRVGNMDDIHFRFVTDSTTFPDVPFEAIWDRHRKKFIRDMSPMARQILLVPSESTFGASGALNGASTLSASNQLTGPLLVIKSNTGAGTLRVGRHTFRGAATRSFSRLPDLEKELTSIKTARAKVNCSPPAECVLETGEDSAAKIEAAIGNGPWDIVHFCGHSVRADDNEVFIVLPGRKALELTAMSVSTFAQILRRGRAKLLILSSCEGASPRGAFRAAQEGVPAIIGFRWEVATSEATLFAERLHQRLAGGAPLARAFLDGLRKLSVNSPAFLSAMLVVQRDHWAEPAIPMED
jgi:hypothetical protein